MSKEQRNAQSIHRRAGFTSEAHCYIGCADLGELRRRFYLWRLVASFYDLVLVHFKCHSSNFPVKTPSRILQSFFTTFSGRGHFSSKPFSPVSGVLRSHINICCLFIFHRISMKNGFTWMPEPKMLSVPSPVQLDCVFAQNSFWNCAFCFGAWSRTKRRFISNFLFFGGVDKIYNKEQPRASETARWHWDHFQRLYLKFLGLSFSDN